MDQPAFIITVDTEGDNLWSRPREITTQNSRYLSRFQSLCEKYKLMPAWMTNYEMAECAIYRDFASDYLKRRAGELGMHLHAWNSPPITALTDDDYWNQPYLIEYMNDAMSAKIEFMTVLLQERFGVKVISHRAGRWAFDERYARCLIQHGYLVDTSVTPALSWPATKGNPCGNGGMDYRRFPDRPYFVDMDRIDRAGSSCLLEVPVTIVKAASYAFRDALPSCGRRIFDLVAPSVHWLRPNGRNLNAMLGILEKACLDRRPCVTFMLHSSELMPGGSPTFKTDWDIENLYDHLEALFEYARDRFKGLSLRTFHDHWVSADRRI
jgi:hypothetical protein